jgi:hypothetical protein
MFGAKHVLRVELDPQAKLIQSVVMLALQDTSVLLEHQQTAKSHARMMDLCIVRLEQLYLFQFVSDSKPYLTTSCVQLTKRFAA